MNQNVTQALILAAGRGSRFGAATDSLPKPLMKVAGTPLICRTILTARKAGIDHFVIVTGYHGEVLEEFLLKETPPGPDIRCLRNERWERPNGLSVLRAKGNLRGSFALLMSDHVFDFRILKNLLAVPLPPGHCRLAVDFHPERVPDLADATKVEVRDERILDIGKTIENYNAIDTGVFLCSEGIFAALGAATGKGKESLSDGIRELAGRGCMEAMDTGGLFWQDVDDEASRVEAERRLLMIS
jgi:1L-myo-inositol 1-phosphate cytidylyltransferase